MAGFGADLAIAGLAGEGVRHIFGVPGTTEIPFVAAANRHDSIDYRLCLHEGVAVGMADGFARASRGALAVANTHATQGTLNGLGYVRAALRDSVPLLLLVGVPGAGYVLDEPNHYLRGLPDVLARVTKWSWQVSRVDQIGKAVHRGVTLARMPPRGPIAILIPQDIMMEVSPEEPLRPVWRNVESAMPPSQAAVREVRRRLEQATSPLVIAGTGVSSGGAVDALVQFSEQYGIPVIGEAVDRGPMLPAVSFPLEHPNYLGSFSLHDEALMDQLRSSDLLLVLGARTLYPRVVGDWVSSATIVQVDENSWEIGKSHPVAVGIVASIEATLAALVESNVSVPAKGGNRPSASSLDPGPASVPGRFGPHDAAQALQRTLPYDALVVDDSQSFSGYVKRYVRGIRPGNLFGSLASHLGWGLPAALGVQTARPDATVVALISDASFALAPQAMWSAARYELPLTIVVINNGGFLSLRRELREVAAEGDQGRLTYLGDGFDIAAIGSGFGIPSEVVSCAEGFEAAMRRVGDGPLLIEARVSDEPGQWDLGWTVPPNTTL